MTRVTAGGSPLAERPCPPPAADPAERLERAPLVPSARPASALHAIARMPDVPAPRFVPDGALL